MVLSASRYICNFSLVVVQDLWIAFCSPCLLVVKVASLMILLYSNGYFFFPVVPFLDGNLFLSMVHGKEKMEV